MAKKYKVLERKFKKLAVLNDLIDSGDSSAGKQKRKLNDSWVKRNSRNVAGTWSHREARRTKELNRLEGNMDSTPVTNLVKTGRA